MDPHNNNPENPMSISQLVQKLWLFKVLVPIIIPITIKIFQNLFYSFDSLPIVTKHD